LAILELGGRVYHDAKAELIAVIFRMSVTAPSNSCFDVVAFGITTAADYALGSGGWTSGAGNGRSRVVILRIEVRHPFPEMLVFSIECGVFPFRFGWKAGFNTEFCARPLAKCECIVIADIDHRQVWIAQQIVLSERRVLRTRISRVFEEFQILPIR